MYFHVCCIKQQFIDNIKIFIKDSKAEKQQTREKRPKTTEIYKQYTHFQPTLHTIATDVNSLVLYSYNTSSDKTNAKRKRYAHLA